MGGDAAEDFVNVAVVFPVMYQDTWRVEDIAEPAEAISLSIEHAPADADNSNTNETESSSAGVIIQSWTIY